MVPGVGSANDKHAANSGNQGEWLVNVADDVVEPMTTLEVIAALRMSRLSEQSLVWRAGMHAWTRLIDVPQLRLAAGSLPPPPVAPRPVQPPITAQADAQRKRDTLPLAFPTLKDRTSVRRPAGLTQPTLPSTAVAAANPQSEVAASPPAPPPSVPAPPAPQPLPALPNSLAPTASDATEARAPGAFGDLEELLANERRADQRRSRRVLLGASLGSVALVAVFAFWVLRSPARHAPAPESLAPPAVPATQVAAPPIVPLPEPTAEAAVAPSASSATPALAARRVAPKWSAPRFGRRPKPKAATARANEPTAESAAPATPDKPEEVAAAPATAPEPTPAANAAPEATPVPAAPAAPDSSP